MSTATPPAASTLIPPTLTEEEVPLLQRLATNALREAIDAERSADTALRAAKKARQAAEENHTAVCNLLSRTKMATAQGAVDIFVKGSAS